MASLFQQLFDSRITRSALAALAIGAGLAGCLFTQGIPQVAAKGEVTTVLPGKGVTVYAAGDIADCRKTRPENSGAAMTARIIEAGLAKESDAAVLGLGDATYEADAQGQFTDCYKLTWGRFKDRTFPSPGNHEYYTPEAIGYYAYFDKAAGPARRGYYSFTLGKWRIISLNSNLKPQEHGQQLAWLRTELAENPARCTLAYWHHPLYSSGGHPSDGRMRDAWRILQAAHAEVILSGHDHDYERFAPQDADGERDDTRSIRQFVVGTGGAYLTPLFPRKPNSEASDNSTPGVLRMVLKETGYEWEFLPVAGGTYTDRGSALCH